MLKWLLDWRGKKKDKNEIVSQTVLTCLYQGDRGIDDLHDNDAVVRLWFPEPLRDAIYQTSKELGTTESKYLREFLVVYLYGVHEILRMKENKTGLYYVPPPQPSSDRGILFSRVAMSEVIPGLGKNIIAIKLCFPEKMKKDLQRLAKKQNIPLGQFMREIFVQHFLGHTVWSERLGYSPEQEALATDWENGKIEEMRVYPKDVDADNDTKIDLYSY
jgi:hypothetical protein